MLGVALSAEEDWVVQMGIVRLIHTSFGTVLTGIVTFAHLIHIVHATHHIRVLARDLIKLVSALMGCQVRRLSEPLMAVRIRTNVRFLPGMSAQMSP